VWRRLLLAYFSSSIGRRAADGAFDVIEFANAPELLLSYRRQAGSCEIEELAPDMGEAGGFNNRRELARLFRLVEIAEPGIAVSVKNAAKAFEMSLRMFAFAIRDRVPNRGVADGGRRRFPGRAGMCQAAATGRLTRGSSLNGAMVSSVI
jgi:hypothetical protein